MASSAIAFELSCKELPGDSRFTRLVGREGMNTLSRWDASLLCEDPGLALDALLGAPARLTLLDGAEGSARVLGLIVTHLAYEGSERGGHRYTLTLAPFEYRLTLRSGYRVLLDKSTQEIVTQLLTDAGVPNSQLVWRLSGTYHRRAQSIQYHETEWSFIERLLAEEGISYFFDFDDDKGAILVFTDDLASHEGIAPPTLIPFADPSNMIHARSFFALEFVDEMTTTSVHVREFDVRAPDVFIEAEAGEGPLGYFEYPARVVDTSAAEARAKVRLEQLQRFQTRAIAKGGCIRVQPGRVLRVEGASDEFMNARYLVVTLEHTLAFSSQQEEGSLTYQHRALMVPAEKRAHRPALPAKAPRLDGLESVVTTGAPGEEIHVDDLGRVKLRFLWDRSGISDDKSSAWTRSLQMAMGGSMLLPRVGWEVPIAYLDGLPERPLVLGRFYNATAPNPYGLPAASAKSTLQSETSPGGGSTHEIRMSDSAGSMELFVHASRDQTVNVGGSASTEIGVNETHDVGLAHTLTVKGSQTHSVAASQTVDIQTDAVVDVKGARSESVGGAEIIDVTGNRAVVTPGSYTEQIGALYGIQCNQSNTVVQGAFTQMIGASLGLAAGLATQESVAAARSESVGGARTLTVARSLNESIRGSKTITAGSAREKASAKVVLEVKGAAAIQVGGSAAMEASGDFMIEAPTITLKVGGKINAGALVIGGGKFNAQRGTTTMKGDIKRKGGSNNVG